MLSPKELNDLYMSVYESMDPEERALRRAEIADKKASRMDAKVASKYAGSETKSAEREDKKSKGKHIHGMTDSYEAEGDIVDEERKKVKIDVKKPIGYKIADIGAGKKEYNVKKGTSQACEAKDNSYLETDFAKRQSNNEKAIEDMKKTKAHADMVKSVRKKFDEEAIAERSLDSSETQEKERLVKGMKKSAADFKKRYGEKAKSVMYATATKQAKDNMDTSKSDRRYGVEK